jgi:putative flavoprotein involved in K+ transport
MLSDRSGQAAPIGRVERFETIVVGAGQAGLAVGYHLAARDADFVILDRAQRLGDSWRERWDSLRLFTPAAYDGLPGMPFPAPSDHLPDKDEVADYLTRYAERHDLPIRLATPVHSLTHDGTRFVLHTDDRTLEADNVVVATGPFQRPKVPEVAGQLWPGITQLHSSEYRNPFAIPDGPVLVVGAGNSGAQIALELARVRKVWLAGKSTGHLPRRFLGRDFFDWIWPLLTRATLDSGFGRRLRDRESGGGDRLIGIRERDLKAAGVVRVGRVTGARAGLPVCDGDVVDPAVIIWCTGFDSDYSWMDVPAFDGHGRPRHHRGVVPDVPGLYFVGLRLQFRVTSSLLGGVREDAAFIADQVAGANDQRGHRTLRVVGRRVHADRPIVGRDAAALALRDPDRVRVGARDPLSLWRAR